ncbi:hypothetical protein L596_023679 [Steinernema carpocapsae]|uniref:Uncharacterized protein n=1 Tax=Steinernema carpocapsae TaxID=34508 RepID=A0A4U5MED4_STECR|nr:hypothetical protein L596_023679 [Steinernema carpocapsae]
MHPLEVCIFLSLAGTVTSWTDRLISSRCLSERELVNVANGTCFEDAFNYTFAGSCPPGFHSEITYSCPPRPNSDPRFEFLSPVFDEYQHDLRSWVLKNMAIELTSVPQLNGTNFDPSNSHYSPPPDSNSIISNFKARNSLQIYETVESQLSRIESSIRGYEDLEQIKVRNSHFKIYVRFKKPATHPNTTFVSMQMNLRMLKIRISDGGRTDAIVKTIGRLLRGESVDEDEFLKEHSLDKFLAVNRDSRFPELEQDLRELYRRLMSSKTPGILSKYLNYMGQPDEHKRLLAQYKEIFQKGKISFKYLDSTNKDFLISSHQEPSTFWTDRLVAHKSPNRDSQNGCLSPQLLLELANRRCQKYPETREYRVENTSELHPEMIKMTLGKPCDSKKTTFKEVSLECRFPQSSIRFPDPSIERHFFHRYFLTLLQEYAGAVKEKKPQEIFERSEIGRFVSFASMSLDSFDPMNHIYGIGTPPTIASKMTTLSRVRANTPKRGRRAACGTASCRVGPKFSCSGHFGCSGASRSPPTI